MDGPPPTTSPNPTYGYGRLDALAAVTLARTPWLLVVKAVDEAGDAYPDLPVVLTDNLTRFQYGSRTGPDGFARLRPVLSGAYTLRVGSGDSGVTRPNVESARGRRPRHRRAYPSFPAYRAATDRADTEPPPPPGTCTCRSGTVAHRRLPNIADPISEYRGACTIVVMRAGRLAPAQGLAACHLCSSLDFCEGGRTTHATQSI